MTRCVCVCVCVCVCMYIHSMKKMLDTTVLISVKYHFGKIIWLVSITFFFNHSVHDFFCPFKNNSNFSGKVTLLSFCKSCQTVT